MDFTGPLMIIVQRVTYISLSVHDGQGRDEKDLSAEQKKEQLKKVPSLLEYFGYILHYSTLLAGPACTYRKYKDFIDGRHFIEKDSKRKEPSSLVPVIEKSLTSLACLVIYFKFAPSFSPILNTDEEFIATHSFLWRLMFAWFSMVTLRMRYYFAFKGAEAVNNLVGLGFSGYDEKGQPLWNGMLHANILKVEFPLNMKMIFDNWNISTGSWLRRCVYDRVTKHRTLAVFALSAAWHGFYGGYYLTFTSAQLCLEAARAFRRSWREKFQKTVILSRVYDVITCLITAMILGYLTVPFVLLDPWQGLRFWRSMYFFGHIISIMVLLLHRGKGSRNKSKTSDTTTTTQEIMQNGLIKSSAREENNGLIIGQDATCPH
ncbi:lysophospholipid acyltransferase 2-like isoform X2 [Actinia tenebrosa]|nr:lysophospholipid acyltransferase 2-like isoform X2 [Actinia tenebrosa]